MSFEKNRGILLVEPSSLFGEIIVSASRQLNLCEVHLISSVRTARQRLDTHDFYGLILAIDDEMGAVPLLEDLRNASFAVVNPRVSVAVMTRSVDASLALKMKALDVRRVLIKPFKVRDVITTIQLLRGPT